MREGTKLTGWLSSLPQYGVLDVLSLFSRVNSPTRVLHLAAEFDHYVTRVRQERLFARLPARVRARSRFVTIAGAAHDANPLALDDRLPAIFCDFAAVTRD